MKSRKKYAIMALKKTSGGAKYKMHQVGELVMYGVHGICRVVDVEERTIDRKKVSYLVLEPKDQSGSRYLVPSGNPNAMAKLRPVLSAAELETLLASPEVRENGWIADENQRKQYYREIIGSGDRLSLLRMVNTLHAHKQTQLALGRKVHLCDENFLRDAQRLLSTEFSAVLGIPADEVAEYVISKMSK